MTAGATGRETHKGAVPWQARIVIGVVIALAIATVTFTNKLLTERYTEATDARAEVRAALYTGNILAELRKTQTELARAIDQIVGVANT